jgi:hypothetical protein
LSITVIVLVIASFLFLAQALFNRSRRPRNNTGVG